MREGEGERRGKRRREGGIDLIYAVSVHTDVIQ